MLNGGIVRVLVHGARGLAALNGGSRPSSNARVVLKLGSGKGSEFTTKLISDTLTPQWSETADFEGAELGALLRQTLEVSVQHQPASLAASALSFVGAGSRPCRPAPVKPIRTPAPRPAS